MTIFTDTATPGGRWRVFLSNTALIDRGAAPSGNSAFAFVQRRRSQDPAPLVVEMWRKGRERVS